MEQIFRAKPCRMLNIWLCSSNNVLKAEHVQSAGPSLLFKLFFNLFLKRNFAKDMQIEFPVPICHVNNIFEALVLLIMGRIFQSTQTKSESHNLNQ